MQKMIDLIADSGTLKDSKLLDYVRKNYLINKLVTNICFISGQGDNENHNQISASELHDLAIKENSKDTIFFLRSFFFDKDREGYLKVIEEMCENDILIFKTDQKKEHVTIDDTWLNKYCVFLSLEDL